MALARCRACGCILLSGDGIACRRCYRRAGRAIGATTLFVIGVVNGLAVAWGWW